MNTVWSPLDFVEKPLAFTLRFRFVLHYYVPTMGDPGNVVGLGTMLQAGRSPIRVPKEVIFFQFILPAALWPWSRLSL
jgi:hypothetical protein